MRFQRFKSILGQLYKFQLIPWKVSLGRFADKPKASDSNKYRFEMMEMQIIQIWLEAITTSICQRKKEELLD